MNLKNSFLDIFNTNPKYYYFSPGRVNLIGEHIDYNGGNVLPAAINLGTYGVLSQRDDHYIQLYSDNFKDAGIIKTSIFDLSYKNEDSWANYVKGVIAYFNESEKVINRGFNLYIKGTLPPQSGLSSSASLLVLIVYIINDLYKLELSKTKIALIAQAVENNYMHMHCGIMDQLIIAKGIKDKALFMDTKTYETVAVNAFLKGFSWVIMNSNYQRKTTDSKYNERVSECQKVLSIIQNYVSIKYLCDLSIDQFNELKYHVTNDTLLRRLRHTVTEQSRVITAKEALKTQDANLFAKLLNESHESLKNDYEVTGKYLDALVESALKSGAIGARVTGAGFGGCAIALVPNEKLEFFDTQTAIYYKQKTGIEASFYHVSFVDGVHRIEDQI
jgi:galactokinase